MGARNNAKGERQEICGVPDTALTQYSAKSAKTLCRTDFPVGLIGQQIGLTGWKAGPTCVPGCPGGDLALYC